MNPKKKQIGNKPKLAIEFKPFQISGLRDFPSMGTKSSMGYKFCQIMMKTLIKNRIQCIKSPIWFHVWICMQLN